MPIYEYIAVEGGCANCSEGFEFFQRPGEEPLEHCFTCKAKLEKVMSEASTIRPDSQVLSDENAERKGFTKYKRVAKGQYEKVAGSESAPDHLGED